eukprot:scaffold107162_cov22-Tisochrysis_lutea.AAC.1
MQVLQEYLASESDTSKQCHNQTVHMRLWESDPLNMLLQSTHWMVTICRVNTSIRHTHLPAALPTDADGSLKTVTVVHKHSARELSCRCSGELVTMLCMLCLPKDAFWSLLHPPKNLPAPIHLES